MTANTIVLCYVASPRTPQEHAAASTVSHPCCSHLLHAVNSIKKVHESLVSAVQSMSYDILCMLQQVWSRHLCCLSNWTCKNIHICILWTMSKACRAHRCSKWVLLTCPCLCVCLYGCLSFHLSWSVLRRLCVSTAWYSVCFDVYSSCRFGFKSLPGQRQTSLSSWQLAQPWSLTIPSWPNSPSSALRP